MMATKDDYVVDNVGEVDGPPQAIWTLTYYSL